jgi:hypothetical protein
MGELTDRIKKLEEQLEEKKEKPKKLKLPWKARIGNGKAKKGYVLVLKINENGIIDPEKIKISEQTIDVDGLPRLATSEYVLKWKIGMKTYPVIIQPTWTMEPFSCKQSLKESMQNGTNINGWRIIYNKMKSSIVEVKKKSFPMWIAWVVGLIVIVGGGYALFTGKL